MRMKLDWKFKHDSLVRKGDEILSVVGPVPTGRGVDSRMTRRPVGTGPTSWSAFRAETDLFQLVADSVQIVSLDFEFVVFERAAGSAG